MHFYLATAHIHEVERVVSLGFVRGVFVPRTEVLQTGRDYEQIIREIARHPLAWIGAQAESFDAVALTREAGRLSKEAGGRLALIMPMTLESIKAVRPCAEVQVGAGLQFVSSTVQALVAGRAGAAQIVVNAKQLGAAGVAIAPFVAELKDLYSQAKIGTEVFVEEVRDVAEVARIASSRADGVICAWDVLQDLPYHPLTDQGIERLLTEWSPSAF